MELRRGAPVQDPSCAVSVRCTMAMPVTVGSPVMTGAVVNQHRAEIAEARSVPGIAAVTEHV